LKHWLHALVPPRRHNTRIMAIFTNKEEEKAAAPKASKKPAAKKKDTKKGTDFGAQLTKSPAYVLKGQRITEKAAYATEQGMYVFEVAQDATKRDVVAVIKSVYNVTPRKVNIVVKQPRAFVARFRGRRGTKSGMKKAYVFLKKGDKIDLL